MPASYRFADFGLDPEERVLARGSEEIQLQDLPLRLLIALVERAPGLVSRDELRDQLWPPGTHLDIDASLNTAVARVRDALADDAASPRFVVTVPRRGYKFVSPVERIEDRDETTRSPRWWLAAAGAAIAASVLAWIGFQDGSEEPPGESPPALISGEAAATQEQLLIARHHANRRSRDGLEKAIAAFQSAVALDAGSAEAYGGLAATYALLGIYDFWRPRESFGPAATMARRAIELDASSAEAHLALGLVAAVADWDWSTSLDEVTRALELAPSSVDVWYWRGSLLSALGRHDEAVESTETALRLDPTSAVVNTALAWRLFQARRGKEAVAQAHRAIELAPGYYDAWDNLKWIERTLGNEVEAAEAWIRAEEIDVADGAGVRRFYQAHGLEGLHRESIKSKLARWQSGRYQSPYDIVLEYTALGATDEAMAWLERSFAERETDLIDLAVDPRLDRLRSLERFGELLARLDLPDA